LLKRAMNTFNNKRELEDYVKLDKRFLVLFCASWCPFCQDFLPAFDRILARCGFDKVVRVYIDDYDNALWEDYSIEAVPTAVLFENGKVTRRLDSRLGFGLSEKTFSDWLKKSYVFHCSDHDT
jgi:thiol-disulfide isomerase/thioredoxin